MVNNDATGSSNTTGRVIDQAVMDDILDALELGEKLNAIKIYKEASGLSLMESKRFVESLMEQLGLGPGPATPRRFGVGSVVNFILLIIVAIRLLSLFF